MTTAALIDNVLDRTIALGLTDLMLHAGFLPEIDDPARSSLLDVLAKAGDKAAAKGVTLAFETGQETAQLLRRTLDETAGAMQARCDGPGTPLRSYPDG